MLHTECRMSGYDSSQSVRIRVRAQVPLVSNGPFIPQVDLNLGLQLELGLGLGLRLGRRVGCRMSGSTEVLGVDGATGSVLVDAVRGSVPVVSILSLYVFI
eukprot:1394980-Amorphochlora_amoeboformis.AAC.1